MLWARVCGHDEHVEGFRRAIRRGRLGHAYLFVGPAGVGKTLFARAMAQCLLCQRFQDEELEACGECPACRQFQAQAHPDFYPIRCPEGKNVLPIELFVGPKELRGKQGLCYELSLSPLAGRRKIAVIDDADLMNQESANALLKMLEEPPPDSLLILISTGTDNILGTIRSRCQTIRFRALPVEIVEERLLADGAAADAAEARLVASVCGGSLSAAAHWLDPQMRSLRDFVCEALAGGDMDSFAVSGTVIDRVTELAGDTAEQRRYAEYVILFCIEFYRRSLYALAGIRDEPPAEPGRDTQAEQNAVTPESVFRVIELCERAMLAARQLHQNVSVPVCLEELFGDLGRISRSMPPS